MNWDKPILTDSGGFHVFSACKTQKNQRGRSLLRFPYRRQTYFYGNLRRVCRYSPTSARLLLWRLMSAQKILRPHKYVEASVERTTRWLYRCKEEMARLNSLPDTINKKQMLFGINQGSTYDDIRINAYGRYCLLLISTATLSEGLPLVRRLRKCTV